MKINIKTTNLKLNSGIRLYIEEKIKELEKFIQKIGLKDGSFIGGKSPIEAWVELSRTTFHHHKGDVFRCEAQLRFPGKSIRTEAVTNNLRFAVDEVKDELQRSFKQYFKKKNASCKRGARKLKKDLKLSTSARFYRKGRIKDEGI